jgi:hypothetical protein
MKNIFLIGLLLMMLIISSCSHEPNTPFEGDVLEAFKSSLEDGDLKTFKRINNVRLAPSASGESYDRAYKREQAMFSFLSEKKLIEHRTKSYPIPEHKFYSLAFGNNDVFDTYAEIGIDENLNKMNFLEFDTGLSGSIKDSVAILQVKAGFFNSLRGPAHRTFYFLPESETIQEATLFCSDNNKNTYTPTKISLIDCTGSDVAFSDICRMGNYDVREKYVWKFDFSRLPECDMLYILKVTTDANKEYTYAARIFR